MSRAVSRDKPIVDLEDDDANRVTGMFGGGAINASDVKRVDNSEDICV